MIMEGLGSRERQETMALFVLNSLPSNNLMAPGHIYDWYGSGRRARLYQPRGLDPSSRRVSDAFFFCHFNVGNCGLKLTD